MFITCYVSETFLILKYLFPFQKTGDEGLYLEEREGL